jgi:endonuclease/exonuclease/phosphatase family metal-dependent hydrolase
MKLISLNIWHGALLKELIKFIANNAKTTDIFVFQEVSNLKKQRHMSIRRGRHKALKVLWEKRVYSAIKLVLPKFTAYRSKKYISEGAFLAVFIKHGLSSTASNDKVLTNPIRIFGLTTRPRLLCVRVTDGKETFWICTTHGLLVPNKWREDTPQRIMQSKRILSQLSKLKGAKILCGDFNLPPETITMKMLSNVLKNLVVMYGITNTRSESYLKHASYTHGKEITDHMLVSNEIKVKGFKVRNIEISDHLPMILYFELKR